MNRTNINFDTIIVPARKDGFDSVFLGENQWRAVNINPKMIPYIKYIAGYQTAPISAITHYAKVKNIELWKDTRKYVLYFEGSAKSIKPISNKEKYKGMNGMIIGPRYTIFKRLFVAKHFMELFLE